MRERMKERRSRRNPKRWKTKRRMHRKVLKVLTGNFTKFFQPLMIKDPKSVKRWTIIPLITTTVAEYPWNQSSLNYHARLPLRNLSILLGRVRGRICLIPMSSRFRQPTFYIDQSRDKEAPNHPSRYPYPSLYLFSPFFLFTVFSVFCREWGDKLHQQSQQQNLMRDYNQV